MDPRVRALYKIAPRPEGPAIARRIIAQELSTRFPEATVDEIKLMVSELVTNGIVHGARETAGPVVLDLCVNGSVRCRIFDEGPGFAGGAHSAPRHGFGGWGLRLVEQLADRWGMQRSAERTEVWFERRPHERGTTRPAAHAS